MRTTPRPGGPLLHNMSAPPRTVIDHPGGDRRVIAHGVVFALPLADPPPLAADLLSRLDGRPCTLPTAEAEAELRRRLRAHVPKLPLPPAAVVTSRTVPGDEECRDLLSTLAVLARSSDHVYLRDKEPNLAALRPGRRVVLLVPRRPS
jgi:hypothetical protein